MNKDTKNEGLFADGTSVRSDGTQGEPIAETRHGDQEGVAFTESGSATVAALLHLLRLMGAELVLNHGTDLAQFEKAVRTRISQFTSPTANPRSRESGLARAEQLIEPVLGQIRAQAELKQSLKGAALPVATETECTAPPPRRLGLLN